MLKQRVLTATTLAVASILALFGASDNVWAALILGMGAIAAWEWAGFARLSVHWKKIVYAGLVTELAYLAIEYLEVNSLLFLTLLEMLILIGAVLYYQLSKGKARLSPAGGTLLLGALFISIFVVSMIKFRLEFSPGVLLMSLFVVWAIDTGAYFSGRRFGKNKLAVFVSPGKTWEGVYGGALLAFIVALIGIYLVQPEIRFHYVLFAFISAMIAIFSIYGDLFESVLKRQADLKDSGSILPGHGGILDRIDSLIIAIPMFYLLWSFGG